MWGYAPPPLLRRGDCRARSGNQLCAARQDARKGGAPPDTVSLPAFGVQVLTDLYAVTGPASTS